MQRNVNGPKWSIIQFVENQRFNGEKVMKDYKKRHFGTLYIPNYKNRVTCLILPEG